MPDTFHTGGVVRGAPGREAEIELVWCPVGGEPEQIQLGQVVKFGGVEGSFTLSARHAHPSEFTVGALKRAGFTEESAVMAIRTQDLAHLVHCGPYSVQLQKPGEFE